MFSNKKYLITILVLYIFFIHLENTICIPITYNNKLKALFSNKKYLITIPKRPTQIEISTFLIEKPVFNRLSRAFSIISEKPRFLISEFKKVSNRVHKNSTYYSNSFWCVHKLPWLDNRPLVPLQVITSSNQERVDHNTLK